MQLTVRISSHVWYGPLSEGCRVKQKIIVESSLDMRPLPLTMQVDLDMLNVSLGTGTLEVHSALLNTQYLDAQLVCVLTLAQSISSPLIASHFHEDHSGHSCVMPSWK